MDRKFLIDAPNVLISGKKNTYSCITATSGEITLSGDSLEINGGWSLYALIEIPTTSSIEVSLQDAQISDGYFELGFGATKNTNEQIERTYHGDPFEVEEENHTITIDKAIVAGSLRINGMTAITTGTPTSGQFLVTTSGSNTTVTFNEEMDGKNVFPSYKVMEESEENYVVTTDSIPQKGEAILTFPVYSSDAEDATISHYAQLTIFSCAVTQDASIGGSYKSASTFGMKLKGIKPTRADKKVWQIAFFAA